MNSVNNKAIKINWYRNMYFTLITLIAILFVFVELVINPQVVKMMTDVDYTLPIMLYALIFILSIFSFIYYQYLCNYILDMKFKDYGILYSLGYTKHNIKKSFLYTLAKSIIISILCGLIAGTLLYYLILTLLNSVFNTKFYELSLNGYFIIGSVYFTIYILTSILFVRKIDKSDIVNMLNYKKQQKDIAHPLLCQNAGFFLVLLGILLLFIRPSTYNLMYALLPMVCLVLGAYLLTLSFPYWFIKLFAYTKRNYINNLFYISQLRTNYKKYSKLLTSCAIIIIFSLYLLIIDISFVTSDNSYDFEKPFDFVICINNLNNIKSVIEEFEANQNQIINQTKLLEISDALIKWGSQDYDYNIDIMPERTYTKLTGKQLEIQNGQIFVLSQLNREYYDIGTQITNGVEWGFQPLDITYYKFGNKEYSGKIVKELWENVYNINKQDKRAYIISNEDYDVAVKQTGNNNWQYFVSASGGENLSTIYNQLKTISTDIESKETNLENQNRNNFIVFILLLIAVIVLLISLFSLIILRIQQNIEEENSKYSNLFSIGYTYEQLKKEIKKEMVTLFFLPLIIGVAITVPYTIFSTIRTSLELIIIIIVATLLFFIFEYIFYKITIAKLSKQYLK